MLMTSFTPSFSLSLSLSPLPPPVSMLVLRHHQVMSRPQMSLLLRRQQLLVTSASPAAPALMLVAKTSVPLRNARQRQAHWDFPTPLLMDGGQLDVP